MTRRPAAASPGMALLFLLHTGLATIGLLGTSACQRVEPAAVERTSTEGSPAARTATGQSGAPSGSAPSSRAQSGSTQSGSTATTQASAALPLLTEPVNDFATVLDNTNRAEIERMCRALLAASGDVVIVTTVPTFAPYGSIQEYAVKLFENQGRGIGEKGKDNGLLVLLAVQDRKVWVEVGYGLEGFITDGFSGETSRQVMVPFFREGRYGDGLQAGVARLIARIAEGRGVSLDTGHVPEPPRRTERRQSRQLPIGLIVFLGILAIQIFSSIGRGGRRRRRGGWGDGGWSGWSGGVGPFGGGGGSWGGGFGGGGGGGGGFGGFGGGRSGGGGGGASW